MKIIYGDKLVIKSGPNIFIILDILFILLKLSEIYNNIKISQVQYAK